MVFFHPLLVFYFCSLSFKFYSCFFLSFDCHSFLLNFIYLSSFSFHLFILHLEFSPFVFSRSLQIYSRDCFRYSSALIAFLFFILSLSRFPSLSFVYFSCFFQISFFFPYFLFFLVYFLSFVFFFVTFTIFFS